MKVLAVRAALTGAAFGAPAPPATAVIPGIQWSVNGLSRTFNSSTNSYDYNFIISATNASPAVCTISIPSYEESWYNRLCGPWEISWGYNANADSAVMTVLNQQLQQDAWFGFDRISTTTYQPNVGPNPVYAVGTF